MIATRARELIVVTTRFNADFPAFAAMAAHGWRIHFVSTPTAVESLLAKSNRKALAGVIDLRDIIYFFTLIASWLVACGVVVDMKKAG